MEIDEYMVGDDIPCYDGCYSSSMEVVKVETVGFVSPGVHLMQY